MIVVLVSLLFLAYYVYRRHKHNQFRREAELWLNGLIESASGPDTIVFRAHVLLKRLALRNASRAESAGLTGQSWIEYLNKRSPGSRFGAEDVELIASALYGQGDLSEDELARHLGKVRHWIKNHKSD